MLLIGEVRKVIDRPYQNKSGNDVSQAILVIEPAYGTQNYEVFLSSKQLQSGVRNQWEALKGQQAAVMVSLFVNHEYKFYKFNAVGDAKPLKAPSLEVIQ